MSERVIKATFSDWRPVKGRKALQLVFEVPLEQQGEVLNMLGPPMPDVAKWCAIALLDEQKIEKPPRERIVQRAVMLCKEPSFQKFVRDVYGVDIREGPNPEEAVAEWLRRFLVIESRSFLPRDEKARYMFGEMDKRYKAWMTAG